MLLSFLSEVVAENQVMRSDIYRTYARKLFERDGTEAVTSVIT